MQFAEPFDSCEENQLIYYIFISTETHILMVREYDWMYCLIIFLPSLAEMFQAQLSCLIFLGMTLTRNTESDTSHISPFPCCNKLVGSVVRILKREAKETFGAGWVR